MAVEKVKEFLDKEGVKYVTTRHSPAFTAQEVAAAAHVPGRKLAKSVVVKADDRMLLVVLPATGRVNLGKLSKVTGADAVHLADEDEFADLFPGCEPGAVPPFGNLFDMEVYVTPDLSTDEMISFTPGSHSELISLAYKDFERLVRPKLLEA